MNKEQLQEMWHDAYGRLMQSRTANGMWNGRLSSSAISTSVSVFALQRIDSERYASNIANGVKWLHDTMKADGHRSRGTASDVECKKRLSYT